MYPLSYLCFRLLGAALPLLSNEQLQLVMRGDVIRHYGEHMVTAKVGATHTAQHCQKGPGNGAASCQGVWAASGINQLLEKKATVFQRWVFLSLVLPRMGKHSCCWEGCGTWGSFAFG